VHVFSGKKIRRMCARRHRLAARAFRAEKRRAMAAAVDIKVVLLGHKNVGE
jgi:hypothetical protein